MSAVAMIVVVYMKLVLKGNRHTTLKKNRVFAAVGLCFLYKRSNVKICNRRHQHG